MQHSRAKHINGNTLAVGVHGTRQPGTNPAPESGGDWIRAARDFSSTRFSDLDQITPESVKQLGVRITFSTGVSAGHEAPPLAVSNTMYVVTPWPNVLYALDLARPGAPVKFADRPKPLSAARGVACCDVVNRPAAYADPSSTRSTTAPLRSMPRPARKSGR